MSEDERPFVEIEGKKVFLDEDYKVGPITVGESVEMFKGWLNQFLEGRRAEMHDFLLKVKVGDPAALFLLLLTAFLAVLVASSLLQSLFGKEEEEEGKAEEEQPEPIVLRDFTIEQLGDFKGENGAPIYIGLKGDVYDCTKAHNHYGPGQVYHLFAGRDTTRSMAKLSFEEEDLANPDVSQLNPFEKDALEDWVHKFKYYKQYPIIGRLSYPQRNQSFTLEQLAKFTGTQPVPEGRIHAPILIAVCGEVLDVSFGGVEMYGPEGPYSKFAGKDISRALAKMSFEAADIDSNDLSDLTEAQMKVLRDWQKKYHEVKKYPVVGHLVAQEAGEVAATEASAAAVNNSDHSSQAGSPAAENDSE